MPCSAALRRIDAATCSRAGAWTVWAEWKAKDDDSSANTVPPQNTPPSRRLGRPKRMCDLRLSCLRSEARGPLTLTQRRATRSDDRSSPESSSENCPESDLQSDGEDRVLSCSASSDPCASAGNDQSNQGDTRRSPLPDSPEGGSQSCGRDSGGHNPPNSLSDDPANNLGNRSGNGSEGGLGGGGLS